MKRLFSLILLSLPLYLGGQPLEEPGFISTYQIGVSPTYERKVIIYELYSTFSTNRATTEEILSIATNVEAWPRLLEKVSTVQFRYSEKVDLGDNQFLHRAAYKIKAPWPVNWVPAVENTIYQKNPPDEKGVITYRFYPDPDLPQEGSQIKSGWARINKRDNKPLIDCYLYFEVLPDIDFLLSLTAPYITGTLDGMFQGLFAPYLSDD